MPSKCAKNWLCFIWDFCTYIFFKCITRIIYCFHPTFIISYDTICKHVVVAKMCTACNSIWPLGLLPLTRTCTLIRHILLLPFNHNILGHKTRVRKWHNPVLFLSLLCQRFLSALVISENPRGLFEEVNTGIWYEEEKKNLWKAALP